MAAAGYEQTVEHINKLKKEYKDQTGKWAYKERCNDLALLWLQPVEKQISGIHLGGKWVMDGEMQQM